MLYKLQICTLMTLICQYVVYTHIDREIYVESTILEDFKIVWNVPSYQCKLGYGIDIDVKQYGIIDNDNGKKDKMVLLDRYVGLYPFVDDTTKEVINGGIPQNVDLQKHLARLSVDIEAVVPDRNFSGFAVIDWESWRPLWDLNFDSKIVYRQLSEDEVRKLHPDWPETKIVAEAKYQFNTAARAMMEATLLIAKNMRPFAKWGYYGFPDCMNYKGYPLCSSQANSYNLEMLWLYNASGALYPETYLFYNIYNLTWANNRVLGQTSQAKLVQSKLGQTPETLPIFIYNRFQHEDFGFMYSLKELEATIGGAKTLGMSGVVLWGSHGDYGQRDRCLGQKSYIDEVLGPYVKKLLHKDGSAWDDGRNSLALDEKGEEMLEQLRKSSFLHLRNDHHKLSKVASDFTVVWNAPSTLCHKYSVYFNVTQYGIAANPGEEFFGDVMTIFYQMGLYPYIKNGQPINGGIPQNVDINAHLEQCKKDIEKDIPDPNFSGLSVIDWESWRPIWERNWDSMKVYQTMSEDKVRKEHPDWSEEKITAMAKEEFENAAKLLIESTLQLARNLRPGGMWGLYLFPHCYNQKGPTCDPSVEKDNNRLHWMFNASSGLFPSAYLNGLTNTTQIKNYIMRQVSEALRVRKFIERSRSNLPVYLYQSIDAQHLHSKEELDASIGIAKKIGADGIVVWSSSANFETDQNCNLMKSYIVTVFGPYIKSLLNEYNEF